MKNILLAIAALLIALILVWRFYPELLWPLVEQTSLKRPLSASTPVYQWRDADGNLQVTDRPPPEGTDYEVKQYALDANILPPRESGNEN